MSDVVIHQNELPDRNQFLRIKCSDCSKEVGFHGSREHAATLLESQGWMLGANIRCPDCVRERKREFLSDL